MVNQPNIVLILADDMGYGDLSCLNDESKIHTPHMDRMATQGMTFTDAHASSAVCTPSRYSIMTGQYSWRGPLQKGVLGPIEAPLIKREGCTWPQFLRDHGYHTALIGKWHLGMSWPFKHPHDPRTLKRWSPETLAALADIDYAQRINDGPVDCGFDTYFGVDIPNFPPYCFIEQDHTVGAPTVPKPETMYGDPGPMLKDWNFEQLLPTFTAKTEQYLAGRAGKKKPFLLVFSSTAPHTPVAPTDAFKGKSRAGVYGDFVMQLDDTVGRIHAALEKHGLADNTLVIVTSDNGSPGNNGSAEAPGTVMEKFGHNSSWILRGRKAAAWDGGHRVPVIAVWPGHITPGSSCAELICLMDLFATSAGILGTPLPAGAAADSLDILPCLLGQKTARPVRNELVHQGGDGLFGVRRGDWKLIMGTGSGGAFFNKPEPAVDNYTAPLQLYNMRTDIRERKNEYFGRPDLVAELTGVLARHLGGPTRNVADKKTGTDD